MSDGDDGATEDRLGRLQGFLARDPGNTALLEDAYETAVRMRAWDATDALIRHGLLHGERCRWQLRQATMHLVRGQWDEARTVLVSLRSMPDLPAAALEAVDQGLAQVALQAGEFEAGAATLRPWIDRTVPALLSGATEVLWLRLLHRAYRLDEALAWARRQEDEGGLCPAARGVASLVALDAGAFDCSLRWADAALRQADPGLEALVARATVALSRAETALAAELSSRAVAHAGADGRAWSTRGFAALQAAQWSDATAHFEQAVHRMPKHVGTWHGLGWSLLAQGHLSRAQAAFRDALALDRTLAESHGGLAVALAFQGERTAAQIRIDRARRLDPGSMSWRYAQAVLSGEHRDRDRMQRLARALLEQRGVALLQGAGSGAGSQPGG